MKAHFAFAIAWTMVLAAGLTGEAVGAAVKGARPYGDAERGKSLADRWCITCHRRDSATASDSAPSLMGIAANPAKGDAYVRGFLMAPHKPMPPLELATQDIEDIISYLHEVAGRR